MISRTALFATLALVSACSANALPGTDAIAPAPVEIAHAAPSRDVPVMHAAAMRCAVTTAPVPRGLRVDAVAYAGAAFDGDFDVRIRTAGPHGESDVVQNGPVRLARGETATLGTTEVSAGRRAQTRVTFTLRDADGEVCRVDRKL